MDTWVVGDDMRGCLLFYHALTKFRADRLAKSMLPLSEIGMMFAPDSADIHLLFFGKFVVRLPFDAASVFSIGVDCPFVS